MKLQFNFFMLCCSAIIFYACSTPPPPPPSNLDKNTLVGFWVGTISAPFNIQSNPINDTSYVRRYIIINPNDSNSILWYDTIINSNYRFLATANNMGTIVGNEISLNASTINASSEPFSGPILYVKIIPAHKATVNNNQITENTTFSGSFFNNAVPIPINGNYTVKLKFVSKVYDLSLLKPN